MTEETRAADHFRYVRVDLPRCLLWSSIALGLCALGSAMMLSQSVRDFIANETGTSLWSHQVLLKLIAVWLLFVSTGLRAAASRVRTTIEIDDDRLSVKTGRAAALGFAWSDISGIVVERQRLYLEIPALPRLEQLRLEDTDLHRPIPRAAVAELRCSTAKREALFDSLTEHSGYRVAGR